MTVTYRIRNFEKYYKKTNKNVRSINWVSVTTKRDGKAFCRLKKYEDFEGVYGCWILVLIVAATCDEPGVLIDDGVPLTIEDLSDMTGADPDKLQNALEILSSDHIGWIIAEGDFDQLIESDRKESKSVENNRNDNQQSDSVRPTYIHNRHNNTYITEHDITPTESVESVYEESLRFVQEWNSKDSKAVRHNRGSELSPKRLKEFTERKHDPNWDWVSALKKIPLQLHRGESNGWIPTVEWFLKEDTVNQILEGNYDWSKSDNAGRADRSIDAQQREAEQSGETLGIL